MSVPYLDAKRRYCIDLWGEGYFDVDPEGFVIVNGGGCKGVRLEDIVAQARKIGLKTPILFRFSSILVDRVRKLSSAFHAAFEEENYQGNFVSVYPIKVNQQRHVVESLYGASTELMPVGLEAGSKPELIVVLALSKPNSTIVCNGYKDREYIRLALIGERMGRRVFIVVEKQSELNVILEEAASLGVTPRIGLRARLSSIGAGNWQNTGGEKSKFGLSASQMVDAIDRMKQANMLSSLQMLHFHLGSQISNVRDIQIGMKEAARFFTELKLAGAGITTVDVGGGLGVDYEGSQSRSFCSVNYSMQEYAHAIVSTLKEACDKEQLCHPEIFTEAGRALTAHHAVLVSNVIDIDRKRGGEPELLAEDSPAALKELQTCWLQLLENGREIKRPLIELYHDVAYRISEINEMYIHGVISLSQKAAGETLNYAICEKLSDLMDERNRNQQPVLDAIHAKLADKLFVNFSIFQSMPDVWGIDQIFPIMPTKNLDKPLTRYGVVQDITCDSDGRIDRYVDNHGLSDVLAMPENHNGDEECLAIFMVGAYQEILGDMHNLFGDTNSVDVKIEHDGTFVLQHAMQGDCVGDILQYVNFDPTQLLQMMSENLSCGDLSSDEQSEFLASLTNGLAGYTYLG